MVKSSEIVKVINDYLYRFNTEEERLSLLLVFLNKNTERDLYDWNNMNGHITTGAFIYSRSKDKFLVLYHKDLDMYIYPGGHIDSEDNSLLEAVFREVVEETGLSNLELADICRSGVPIDIDTHIIPYNERVDIDKHCHFDFRYLYFTENMDVSFDQDEMSSYRWVSSSELVNDKNFGRTIKKILEIMNDR